MARRWLWLLLICIWFRWVQGFGYDEQGKLALHGKRFESPTVCIARDQGVLCYPRDIPLPPLVKISAGATWMCGIEKNGTVVCWDFSRDKLFRPQIEQAYQSINMGWNHGCGIVEGNRVDCFGSGTSGQSTPPDKLMRVRSVSCGKFKTYAVIVQGGLACWGKELYFPHSLARLRNAFSEVAMGDEGGCASDNMHAGLVCWLSGTVYRLPGTGQVSSIAVSMGEQVCVLVRQAYIRCWKYDTRVEIKNNFTTGLKFASLVSRRFYTCGLLLSETQVICWSDSTVFWLEVRDGGLHLSSAAAPHVPAVSPVPADTQALAVPPSPTHTPAPLTIPSQHKHKHHRNISWWLCRVLALVVVFVGLCGLTVLMWRWLKFRSIRNKYAELKKSG